MAEAQKMVHLTPVQKKRKGFKHPLTGNAPAPLAEESLNRLLLSYFEAKEERRTEIGKRLIVNYLRLLGSTVARYLYHWPVSRRFLDEMISSGTEAITKIIVNLKPKQLDNEDGYKSLGRLIENTIRQSIETVINDYRGIAPASERTNRTREAKKQPPVYGLIKSHFTKAVKSSQGYDDINSFIFEVEDAIKEIAQTNTEKQVLAQENWGLSSAELGKKIGKSSRWVLTKRNCLYERYMKLGGL